MGVRRTVLVGGLVWVGLLAGAAGALALPAFAPVTGSPFVTGTFPHSVAFSASDGLALVQRADFKASTVSVFSVGGSGWARRWRRCQAPRSRPAPPSLVAFSPTGGLLATANDAASTVSMFSVRPGGALTPVTGSPFATGDARSPLRSVLGRAARDRQLLRLHRFGVLRLG